jgi:hypothetical protein
MRLLNKKPKHLSPDAQNKLDGRLIEAAMRGETLAVQTLLAAGANVHAWDDGALCGAAENGHTETVKVLLVAGADVNAGYDYALCWSAECGHMETLKVLAQHMFAPESWRGKSRTEIEARANSLYGKIKACNSQRERLREAGTILLDCALCCWEQVRPPPPKLQISPLPAQPRPV